MDDLIADVKKDVSAPPAEGKAEKKSKKDKNIQLVFFDDHISPEEKMARLERLEKAVTRIDRVKALLAAPAPGARRV